MPQRGEDLGFGPRALHRGVIHHKGYPGGETRTGLHHVLQGGRFGARHHTDAPRIKGKDFFNSQIKKAFREELLF